MQVYKAETAEILTRFMEGRITHTECTAALDSALASVIPGLSPLELHSVQMTMADNLTELAREVGRRKTTKQAEPAAP
jgi:hypothetical protein